MASKFKVGDRVTHFRAPGRVGAVVAIDRDKYYSDAYTWHVAWSEGGPGIPYDSIRDGDYLKKAED